jgi:hypothetical protein
MSYKNANRYKSYYSHMQRSQRQDIRPPNTYSSVGGGAILHMPPTAADYEYLFGHAGSDIVANTAVESVRYDPWRHAPQCLQRHHGESRFAYMDRWQIYKENRDMRAHEETVLAKEDIDFARFELTKYVNSIQGRRRDLDPRFRYNLERLVKKAEDTLTELTKCHTEQARIDIDRFFKGPHQPPTDMGLSPIIPYIFHDTTDDLSVWDTPPGPRYMDRANM